MIKVSGSFRAYIAIICTLFFSLNAIGKVIPDFSLKNINGKYVSLKDYPDAKGFIVIFTCNHCPFAKLYPHRMNELNKKYKPKGIPLITISSADTLLYEDDTYPKMVEAAKRGKFNFPYLSDWDQSVAKSFSAQKTPQAFVLWKENGNWVIKYSGAIDDNGAEPQKVQHTYLQNAVNELLNGKPVKVAETRSVGCAIRFRK